MTQPYTPPISAIISRPRLLAEREAAARLHLSVHTLRQWRHLSQGVPWVRLGRRVFYEEAALAAYIAANTITPRGF